MRNDEEDYHTQQDHFLAKVISYTLSNNNTLNSDRVL